MSKADNVIKNRLLMKDAEEARDSITKNQQKEIKKLYSDWAKEVGERAEYFKNKTTPSSVLAEQQLRILQNQMVQTSRQVSNELNNKIVNNMYLVSESVVKSNSRWLKSLGFTNLDKISAAFTNVPDQQVRRLITGQVYQSGWSLSKAIWSDNEKSLKDIYGIVASGMAQNRPIYEIAKNLEAYVNPNRKLDWNLTMEDGRRIYKKSVDYNAQRLARTLVQHSYQASFVAVTKDNPLITSYRWIANGSRVCPLCMEMDGRIFEKDNLPLDHPNGMCTMEPVIDDNYLDRLANWVADPEGSDPELDKFAKNFGYDPKKAASSKSNQKNIDRSKNWIGKNCIPAERSKSLGFDSTQRKGIIERLTNKDTSDDYINAFARAQKELKGAGVSKNGSCYYPNGKSINLNENHIKNSLRKSENPFTTYFHEMGHAIDNLLSPDGKRFSTDKEFGFKDAMKKDMNNLCLKIRKEEKASGFKGGSQTLRDLNSLRWTKNSNGVQDVLGAMKHMVPDKYVDIDYYEKIGKSRFGWGHSDDYWNRGNTTNEAASELFAHMSAGQVSKETKENLERYFPEALKSFETILKNIP